MPNLNFAGAFYLFLKREEMRFGKIAITLLVVSVLTAGASIILRPG